MLVKMETQDAGGGGFNIDLSNMQVGATNQQFPATIGKTYLVQYTHGGGGGQVLSGGTALSEAKYNDYAGNYVYIGIVTATATTVVMKGTNVPIHYCQLD